MSVSRRRLLGTLVLAGGLAMSAVPLAEADSGGNEPGLDACDWASFRNGPANPGASTCDRIGVTNVATLRPHLLYRTKDSVTSTPAVVDGMLYVGAWDGTFYAFDTRDPGVGDPSFAGNPIATVEPAWTFQIDDTNGVSFGRIVSSPTVTDIDGTRVVIFAGGATVYALDAASGLPLAQLCLDPRSDADAAATGGRCRGSAGQIEVESSPIVVPHPDGSVRILIGQDNHNTAGIGRTGVVKLRLQRAGDRWSMTPEWKFDPEARVAYDEADEGPAFLTHLSGTGDGCGGVWGTPAVDIARDIVVFGTASCKRTPAGGLDDTEGVAGEKVYAVRYSDGAELWRYNPPRPWGTRTDDDFGASPQLFELDGVLMAGAAGKDGSYYAIYALDGPDINGQPATGGQLLWGRRVGQPGHTTEDFAVGGVLGSPALGVANGRPAIFVTTAISTPVGAPFDYGTVDSIDRSLAEDPGRMLSIHALDAATGAIVWRSPLTRQTYGHPTYANGLVFVTSTVGFSAEAFEASTGVPVWRSNPLNGAPSSGVAVTDDGIYLGAGTRQTDLGFKIQGDDSSVPDGVQDVVGMTAAAEYVGSDPQERLSGIWGFRIAG